MESTCFSNSEKTPLIVGKQDLEKAFKSILDQLANQRCIENSSSEREKSYHDTVKTPCSSEMPSFTLSYGGAAPCNSTTHGMQGKTACSQRKVLQIQLPEYSEDPCRILITSHRDQVTIKYLQQGQQFTFSSGSFTTEHDDTDQVSPNVVGTASRSKTSYEKRARENLPNSNQQFICDPDIQNDNPIGIVIQDVVSQRRGLNNLSNRQLSLPENCAVETRERVVSPGSTSETCLPNITAVTSLNDSMQNDRESSKRQSLNNFIDSLVDKRSREASKNDQIGNINCFKNRTGTCPDTTNRMTTPIDIVNPNNFPISPDLVAENKSVNRPMEVNTQPSIATVLPSINISSHTATSEEQAAAMKKLNKKGRFKCQYCYEMFQQRSQCLLHISQKHVEERPHHCKLCDATFKKKRSLEYHLRHHDGERRFKCNFCSKAFKEKYHLTVHIRTHTGERPFECKICGKAFKQTNELTSHIRTHTGERPYKCDLCDMWFRRKPQLDSHRLSHFTAIDTETTSTNDNTINTSFPVST